MGQEESVSSIGERNNVNNKYSSNNNFSNSNQYQLVLKPSKSMFEFLYVIGRGGFGKVWSVRYKKSHAKFALKEMSKVKIIDRKSEKSIKNEREFLSKLHHPFMVNMICSFQDYDNLYLVMDLLTGGDLRYHICHKKQFNEDQSRFFSSCILLGLEYIHSNNIIHRDIKPENLVLDEKGYVRITDFGVAKKNLNDNSSETSGTPGYMAPEVLCARNHSFPVDFFALGVIIYEFMNGYRPYLGRNRKEIKEAVLAKQVHVHRKQLFENGWSFESCDLINKLLYRKQEKRLGCNGIKDIKQHPWFKSINWEELYNKNLTSPFLPKEGDNFDKRYCEGVEQIDTQTKERYQYYKSKSKFKSLFLNYTFVRDEDKQEYIKSTMKNKMINNTSNTLIPSSSTKSVRNISQSKYANNVIIQNKYKSISNNRRKGYENNNNNNEIQLLKQSSKMNSMTNIHSINIAKEKPKGKNGNRNRHYYNQLNQDNNMDGENNDNQKLFYSTFKVQNNINENKLFSENTNLINEVEGDNTINVDLSNKINELKVFINKKEDNIGTSKKNDNNNFYDKINDNNLQLRSSSTISKRKNDYYSLNSTKFNQVNSNNINNDEDNNKNFTSIKININAPISINKYKYNRSSSQTNIFYDTKGTKSSSGKLIKYININGEMEDKAKIYQEPKNNNTRNSKTKYKNASNSSNIYINPSQFVYYPSHKGNNISNNLSNNIKNNNNKYITSLNSGNTNLKNNNEYLMYKTSRYINSGSTNNINNNNININFNINNINNNINNINQINSDNTNAINRKKNSSKVKGASSSSIFSGNNNPKKYLYNSNINNGNSNMYLINSNNNNNLYNRYSNKNNMIIECEEYDSCKFNNNNNNSLKNSGINKNNKNKTLSKASSMKSFNFSSNNYIEKYLEQKEKNKILKNKKGGINENNTNNHYYNFEIMSPGINNNIIIEDNISSSKPKSKSNTFFRKQKTQQLLSNRHSNIPPSSNLLQPTNKYAFLKKIV